MNSIKILPFETQYAMDFARLNYEWLTMYFEVEEHDREMLDDPQGYIIDRGGQILLAKSGGMIVGTVALLTLDNDTFEVAKMAVTPAFKGQHIGKKLMIAAIEYARKRGKTKLMLESNTKLTPALKLYESVGFVKVPDDPSTPYIRCDIRMELVL